ncbi:MAG TPA: hypothetical protein VI278_03840 [Nitrososphaeraceae archaeon]
MPIVVFTIPPLASVGLQEGVAKEHDYISEQTLEKTLLVGTHLVE